MRYVKTSIARFVSSITLTAVLSFAPVFQTVYANEKYIAIVHSYHEEYTWVDEINEGIQAYHQGKNLFNKTASSEYGQHTLKYFYMDSKRHQGNESYFRKIAIRIIKELNEIKPVVTILCDDEALKYIALPLLNDEHHRFVFLGLNRDPREYSVVNNYQSPEYNATGLISEHPFVYSLKLALELFPGTKGIYAFFDNSVSGRGIYENLMKHAAMLNYDIRGRIRQPIVTNDWSAWKKMVLKNQNEDNLFIIGTFHSLRDRHGKLLSEGEVIEWITQHSRVPELAVTSSNIQQGFLLTISNPGFVHGYLASDKAASILSGTPVSQIPIEVPRPKAIHVNMERAGQLNLNIPVEIIAVSKYFDELGY